MTKRTYQIDDRFFEHMAYMTNKQSARIAELETLLAAAPAPTPQPVARGGMLAAAEYIDAKADKYLEECTGTERDTGAMVFHYGEAGRDYHSSLVELAEELRTQSAPVAAPDLLRRLLADHQRTPHHADLCALCREMQAAIEGAPVAAQGVREPDATIAQAKVLLLKWVGGDLGDAGYMTAMRRLLDCA